MAFHLGEQLWIAHVGDSRREVSREVLGGVGFGCVRVTRRDHRVLSDGRGRVWVQSFTNV